MKHFRKIMALMVVAVMAMAMTAGAAWATDDDQGTTTVSTPSITINSKATDTASQKDTTAYKAWKMLDAAIAEDPTSSGATQSDGKVSYYVTTEAAKTALSDLFTFTQVGSDSKWYATPKSDSLTAEDVVNAFKDKTDAEMTAAFGNPTEFAQTTPGGSAQSGTVDAGYYFIKSSLGSNIAIQTLTAVEIDEKNQYVTDEKTIPEGDENSEIGQDIEYTLTVNVPASANDTIVLTDTMGKGLTFKSITQDTNITGTVSEVTAADNDATKFTITYSAADVKALVANGAATITVKVTVTVNGEAAIDTDIPNTLDLKYGNNYEAVPSTVKTKTTKATFAKVDGDDGTMLTGAKFKLLKGSDGAVVNLVEVTAGEVYRVADPSDTTTITEIVTAGKNITINGLDADETYKLEETAAPAGGYNKLTEPVELQKNESTFVHTDVENNKGTVLPSTGGMGTTILYIVGGIMVLIAGVYLVTKRRMGKESNVESVEDEQ